MIKEIYIRDFQDPYFEPGIVDFENDIESVITQVRVLLGTKPGDVIGSPQFGIDLEYLVFNTVKDSMKIQDMINEQLQTYVQTGKNITLGVNVSFGDSGHGYDIALVDILLNGKKALGLLVNKE